jgi:4-amino-4-deoxy-L-arabinose transferase-like glycosyltransferase
MLTPGYGLDTGSRKHLIFLFSLTLVVYFTGLGERDFWAPVEPRYAEIARVMFAKGEWIVPTVNGDLYTDKPILYFWMVLIAAKITGAVNEWTVRLPVALGGIGFVLTTYYLARDLFSPRIGLLAAAMLATSVRVIWEARWAHIDVLFCFFFLLSIYYGARAFLKKGQPNEILLAYVFMGFATLAKGLIGIVLPALLLISFMLVRRDWRMILDAKLHLGIPLFLAIILPWVYLINSATDGKWLSEFIYVHHFQRYTSGFGHRQPFYYYLTTLPVDFLPWTIFVIPALFTYRDYRDLLADPAKLFLLIWFFAVFLFFSASDTKRDLYLMPLLPAVAIFTAYYMDDLVAERLPQSMLYRSLALIFFSLIALAGLVLPLVTWFVHRQAFWISLPAAGVIAAGGGIAVAFVVLRNPRTLVAATLLMMVCTLMCAVIWIFPYIERFKSRRFFAMEIQRIVPASSTVYIYADTMNDFNYYTQREVMPVLRSRAEIEKCLSDSSGAYVLIKSSDLRRLAMISPQQIRISAGVGQTLWNLVALGNPQWDVRLRCAPADK